MASGLRVCLFFLVFAVCALWMNQAHASAPGCGQARVEALLGAPPPPGGSTYYIVPSPAAAPIYQWESNFGYCGEVSLMSAGLTNGQWVSQSNTRVVCGGFFGPESNGSGPSLEQAGHPHGNKSNLNAELLIENPNQGFSGPYDYDFAARCAANAGLSLVQYQPTTGYHTPNTGLAGYEDFMSWIKAQAIAGHRVTLGVLLPGGTDPQDDHIVDVLKIGTNHAPNDPTYYPDDVLYFDDHGVYTLKRLSNGGWAFAGNPSVPLGAGKDKTGCTPYIFGYTFASLVKTRLQENLPHARGYAVVMPDANRMVATSTGNPTLEGTGTTIEPGPHDFAFAITGPIDPQEVTMPVTLTITDSKAKSNNRQWVETPRDENSTPAAGYNYETPYIGGPVGTCNGANCVSNTLPPAMQMTFQVTVSGLTPGTVYRLYEYDFPVQTGAKTGTAAALPIPTGDFNAQGYKASSAISFFARAKTYTVSGLVRPSTEIVVFRAVPASAP